MHPSVVPELHRKAVAFWADRLTRFNHRGLSGGGNGSKAVNVRELRHYQSANTLGSAVNQVESRITDNAANLIRQAVELIG